MKFLAAALLAGLVLLALPPGAEAMLKAGPNTAGPGAHHRLKAAAGVTGLPGSTVPFTVFWGLRAYSSAQLGGTTNAVKLRRASDSLELDIKILANGAVDAAAATAHCAATTCFVSVLYDQLAGGVCGGSCNLVQATPANQLAFVADCGAVSGNKPCLQAVNSTSVSLATAGSFTPATGVTGLHFVGGRTVGSAGTTLVNSNGNAGNRLNGTAANTVQLTGGGGGPVARPAPDGAVHVLAGVINGAASALYVDGVATTGTATGNTVAGAPLVCRGNTAVTLQCLEGGFIDNAVMSQAQAEALNANARAWYGLP